MAGAWALSIREAAKKAGGMQLDYGGWDQKLRAHNEQSGGRLHEAMTELANTGVNVANTQARGGDLTALRQEMLSGAYGNNYHPVRVGPW